MVIKYSKSFFRWLIAQERSPRKLALSVCMGVYIAFSPFIGMHTLMTIIFSRFFMLNFAVLFAVSVLVNNPWTMIPVYSMGYFFGTWLLNVCSIDALQWDPVWFSSCNGLLQEYLGISGLSLSVFLIGGNVLGLLIGVALYPVMKYIFTYCMVKKQAVVQ